jgi:hypothetical protein
MALEKLYIGYIHLILGHYLKTIKEEKKLSARADNIIHEHSRIYMMTRR